MANPILNILQGETVNFSDNSIGDITGYDWKFPGGSPTGATSMNPSVRYVNIGDFNVELTTEDLYGVSNTELKTGIIKVEAAPWGVNFYPNTGNTILLGQEVTLINNSIGSPDYSEWTFPTDGVLASGVTFSGVNAKDNLGPLRYMNWEDLTGSHIAQSGTIFTTNATLFSSSEFALGSKTKSLNINKLGPLEYYQEHYLYDTPPYVGSIENMGYIDSSPYPSMSNTFGTMGATSIGLGYSYSVLLGGLTVGSWEQPIQLSSGDVLHAISFKDDYANTYWNGSVGPTGPYNPHVDGEIAYIFGRAFSPFNVEASGRYKINAEVTYNEIGGVGSGKTLGENIEFGNYSSDIKNPAPGVNEIVNPNFLLIKDTFNDISLSPFSRSYLTLYTDKKVVNGKTTGGSVYIPKTTIENLYKHPERLPDPGPTGYTVEPSTIGITTSADIHLSSDERLTNGSWARLYPDTIGIVADKSPLGPTSVIGRYPCMPSQYILPPEPTPGILSNVGPFGVTESIVPPLGINIEVTYTGETFNMDIYFGNPNSYTRNTANIYIPEAIDPVGPLAGAFGPTAYAQAYGNDSNLGSWILVEDTPYGIGIASYINAYINDSNRGLPGGTNDLVAKADDYWTLPTPYSDNNAGTIISGGTGGSNRSGLSIEVKSPMITSVKITELYGRNRYEAGIPFYNMVSDNLINIPTTWDYGRFKLNGSPTYPPYIEIENWGMNEHSFLGISSVIKPFSFGPISENSSRGENNATGIKIGGSL